MSAIPAESRARMAELRAEFAARCVERAPAAWARLSASTRCVLLMLAGVDGGSDHDLAALAARDLREFTPAERAAVAAAADGLRWELHAARNLGDVL